MTLYVKFKVHILSITLHFKNNKLDFKLDVIVIYIAFQNNKLDLNYIVCSVKRYILCPQ